MFVNNIIMFVKKVFMFLINNLKGGVEMSEIKKDTTKQQEIIKMMNDFCELSEKEQMYVSGVIYGMSMNKKPVQKIYR